MKQFTTIASFAAMIIAGSAMADNTFPCGKEMNRNNHQINIAATVLQPRISVAEETYQQIVASN